MDGNGNGQLNLLIFDNGRILETITLDFILICIHNLNLYLFEYFF